MKKTLLSLLTLCTVFQFTNTQAQTAPLDSNVTCDKATLIPHTFNNNEFLVDSFTNKTTIINSYSYQQGYYTFVATAKSGKIKVNTNTTVWVNLFDVCPSTSSILYTKGSNTLVSSTIQNLTIGKKYYISLSSDVTSNKVKISAIANKKDDNVSSTPTTISGTPYNFSIADYSKGRENDYSNASYCKTTKADTNVVTVFVKFTATSTSATLALNLDNPSLESTLGLVTAPNTCKPIQKNTNLRTDTFTGLTIGTDYTVRIEIGGDAALGYARIANNANNASITLVGGTVTGLENDAQPTFSIAPNPSNGSFTFVSDNNADLVIYDLLGTKVAEFKNVSSNQNIDLQLAKGIYLLNVSTEKGSKVEELVIE